MLEEDGDSGYGGGNSKRGNIVKEWKQTHGLKHFFNPPGSPDLSPIENCWKFIKQYVRLKASLNCDLEQLIKASWEAIKQDKID